MAAAKYPWKSTPCGESFSTEMPNGNYARGVAWQRKRRGEFWKVKWNAKTKIATYTRLNQSQTQRYNWSMLPGQVQQFRFSTRSEAANAMFRCCCQVRRQNKLAGPTARNWLVCQIEDGLGFELRRRQC